MSLSERIKKVRGNLTQQAFADSIGVNKTRIISIENERAKKLDSDEILVIIEKFQIDPLWLLTGNGEMLEKKRKTRDESVVSIGDVRLAAMQEWLQEMWDNAPDEIEKMWLRREFEKKFPEFKDWLEKKERDRHQGNMPSKTNKLA